MADAQGVDVRQGAAHLVGVQLHVQPRHALPRLAVVLADAVHRFRNILQHQIQVHLLAPPHPGIRLQTAFALRQVDCEFVLSGEAHSTDEGCPPTCSCNISRTCIVSDRLRCMIRWMTDGLDWTVIVFMYIRVRCLQGTPIRPVPNQIAQASYRLPLHSRRVNETLLHLPACPAGASDKLLSYDVHLPTCCVGVVCGPKIKRTRLTTYMCPHSNCSRYPPVTVLRWHTSSFPRASD